MISEVSSMAGPVTTNPWIIQTSGTDRQNFRLSIG
jgi:hypothetical protein